ncbi:MAG: hypothetical protein P4L51_22365 [Puia sp.]|nr:hypothetical protein [Puia sp.]
MNENEQPVPDTDRKTLIRDLNGTYELAMPEHLSASEMEDLLAEKLNILIRDDFNSLVTLLYRIDIHEGKLRQLLKSGQGTDAGKIIARLIIDRQLQKIESRRKFKRNSREQPGAEKDVNTQNDGNREEERW